MICNKKTYTALFTGISLFTIIPQAHADDVKSIITDGDVFGEVRYRYEYVEQDGITENANASTVRTNLGFKTGKYKGFQGLIEGQLVQNIGADSFNDTVGGNAGGPFPIVADPDNAEINRAWVSWTGFHDTELKIGRQDLNIDNQRFVGTVGWRQNDQTFDSILLKNSGFENIDLTYSYIANCKSHFW